MNPEPNDIEGLRAQIAELHAGQATLAEALILHSRLLAQISRFNEQSAATIAEVRALIDATLIAAAPADA